MISRIRIEGYGKTAAALERELTCAAHAIATELRAEARHSAADEPVIVIGPGGFHHGEQVIERNLDEDPTSRLAFRGRLVIHADITTEGT